MIKTDIAIIGSGITSKLTALALAKDIRKVAEIFNVKQKNSEYLFVEVSKASSNISSKVKKLLGKIYAKSR